MDDETRARFQARMARHQPGPWWRKRRCRECALRWPCLAHTEAANALQLDARLTKPAWVRDTALVPLAPVLTRGPRARAKGRP